MKQEDLKRLTQPNWDHSEECDRLEFFAIEPGIDRKIDDWAIRFVEEKGLSAEFESVEKQATADLTENLQSVSDWSGRMDRIPHILRVRFISVKGLTAEFCDTIEEWHAAKEAEVEASEECDTPSP